MMLRVLFLFFILSAGCVSQKDAVDADYSELVLESGDFVKMDFVGRIEETGEVFHTTYPDVAFDPDTPKSKTFMFAERYEPIGLTLGKGEILPAVEVGMVGMKIGETRTITLNPEDGYGENVPQRIVTLPRTTILPKFTDVAVSEFTEATGREPQLNETIPLNYWNVTIVDISGENMTLSHEPENNTIITTEYGPGHVTHNDTHVVTRLNPELDSAVITSYGAGIITYVNDTHFTIDYNHPLAGKKLVFEVTVNDIMKADRGGAKSITWADHDAGIDIAKSEKKRAIIYFSIEDCKACEAMDAITFSNPQITAHNDEFVWINVDITSQPQVGEEYGVEVYPTILILEKDGEFLEGLAGYISPYDFAELIDFLSIEEKA